jgi:hypothetical protein
MKKKVLQFGLIYLILLIYLIISLSIYAIYIMKTYNNQNIIINLIIGSCFYLLVGLLYSNHIHKRGLIVGALASLIHLFVLKFVLMLTGSEVSFHILEIIINIICGGIGGFLGILFKKII